MTGERLAWYRLAALLGFPVVELKARITYREFLDWWAYIALEEEATAERALKTEYAMALIAAEVRRGWVAEPKKVATTDFIIAFKDKEEVAAPTVPKPSSKKVWARFLGIKLKD